MYTFLCQKIDGEIAFDFVLGIKNAVEFVNWYNDENILSVKYAEDILDITNVDHRMIPVGSVEFVEGFYKKYHNITLKPINIPLELKKYALREVWDGSHLDKRYKTLFCKSNDRTKGFTDVISPEYNLPKGEYQFSELIGIESEWRCFIHRGELLGVHNYINSIDQRYFPDMEKIHSMIKDYGNIPAYTLDVGVNNEGTFPIEVHDIYSCGLYGFMDYNNLIKMHIESHRGKVHGV